MTKICNKCKFPKNENEFSFRIKTKGTRQPYCKKCDSDIKKKHVSKSKQNI